MKDASISKGWVRYKRQWQLQLFVYMGLIWLIVFSWAPLFGITIAFKDYSIRTGVEGIFTSEFNHFQHFKDFFGYYNFNGLLRNTLVLSITKLLATFPAAILFAILINEVRINSFKRVIQTVSYLPHFISWVLVYTLGACFKTGGVFIIGRPFLWTSHFPIIMEDNGLERHYFSCIDYQCGSDAL